MKTQFLIFLFLLTTNLIGQEMNLNIIPMPQKVIVNDEPDKFHFPEKIIISFNHSENSKHKAIVNILNETLANKYNIKTKFDSDETSTINLYLTEVFAAEDSIPKEHENEAYTLTITKYNISVKAQTFTGIYYAVLTLAQIINNSKINELPQLRIIDYPNMKFRGISDDISRGQVSNLENFKRIIKFISEYKMNTYMPYLEDMIQFESFPEIGVGRGALSKSKIIEIVNYADEYFVEVIPIFQTLGHYENILSQKEFIKYADWPGAASLDVTNPKTYIFLETLLKEVFEIFPSKYFHMGADESYDVGFGNSRKLVEQSDLATVHANHYKRIYDICKKYDKEVMMYGDIILSHPDILDKIPKDITIVDWHYHPKFNYPSTKIFSSAGFNYIVSPTVWNFNSAFPENFFAIPNIKTLTEDGINNNSIGMINSSWGDFGAETFREYNLYGYAWSAQCSWNINEIDVNNFNKIFFKQFFGTEDHRIEKLYNDLADPVNQLVWGNIWRHPLLDYRKPDWRQFSFPQASKFYWMQNEKNELQTLAEFKKSVTKNKDFWDLLEFTLKLKKWFLLKQETQIDLHNILDSTKVDTTQTIDLIDQNVSQLIELKTEFSTLWKIYNTKDNLWMIEEKFDRLITYFEETKNKIVGQTLEPPLLKSKWIYYPNDDTVFIYKVDFANKVAINNEIKSAQLQLIGDTFAKLFINGKEVDSVYTKRSGSLWIEQQRIKLLNVSKYLKQGENDILVEARNYYDSKTPGINIIAEIVTEKDTINFMSDENWKTIKLSSDNDSTDSIKWIEVEVKEDPLEIIAPNFVTKRKSWIER